MKKSTIHLLIIYAALFGLAFFIALKGCDREATPQPTAYSFADPGKLDSEPLVRELVPLAQKEPVRPHVKCSYRVMIYGQAALNAAVDVRPVSDAFPDGYRGEVRLPWHVSHEVTLIDVPMLSTEELEQRTLEAYDLGGVPAKYWTFAEWLPVFDSQGNAVKNPRFYELDKKCVKAPKVSTDPDDQPEVPADEQ